MTADVRLGRREITIYLAIVAVYALLLALTLSMHVDPPTAPVLPTGSQWR